MSNTLLFQTVYSRHIPCCFLSTTKKLTQILDFGLLHVRRTIDLNWTNMEAPSIELWIKELSQRLTYISKGKTEEFVQL